MRFAGAGVTNETEWQTFLDPFAGGQGVDDGGIDVGVGIEIESAQRLLPRERCGLDAAFGAAACAVVAFGDE
jgi:hypothetical protein